MKLTKKIIILTILLLMPSVAYAKCSDDEKLLFESHKDGYTVEKEYNYDTKTYNLTFNAPIHNYFRYAMEYMNDDNQKIKFDLTFAKDSTFIYRDLGLNKYTIKVVGITDTCDDVMKTIKLNLKAKNKYASDPLCEDIKEFVLCQEEYDKEIDYNTFVSRVNKYKESLKEKEVKKPSSQGKVLDIDKTDLTKIIVIIVFVILVIITLIVTIRTNKKSRRLE